MLNKNCCDGYEGFYVMHKQRKIIGVIISHADGLYQRKFIEGVQRRAYALDYDVLVFSTLIKTGASEMWRYGEQNIYNMINYDVLDAVIYVPDSIHIEGVAEKIENKIKTDFKKPVVSAEIVIDGFESVLTDDVVYVKKIVSHLIEKHQVTDIAFVTGLKGHPHAVKRLEGYYEAMLEHNLTIDNSRVFYGNFWYDCGEQIVKNLLEAPRPLPQAIACGSDTMAIGICEVFKKKGIRVPENVIVTGYDSIPAGVNYYPCITSAVIPSDVTGACAVNKVHQMLTGEKCPEPEYPDEILVGQSCGCNVCLSEKQNELTQKWRNDDLIIDSGSSYNYMLEGLLSETDLNQYFWVMNWFTYQLGEFDGFYVCLCDNWDNLGEDEHGKNFIKDGYSDKMHLVLEHGNTPENEHIDITHKFSLAEMLPNIYNKRDYPTTYIFTPLHFNDRCFGYAAISYGREIKSYDSSYRIWMKYVNSSLESLRRQRRLKMMYRHMRENATIDNMTKIYNRNGFNLYADEIFNNAKKNGKNMLIILGDLNELKYINDTFGHIEGDAAIKAAASAFRMACGGNKICFRIGGDEFILIDTGDYGDGEIELLKNQIRMYLLNEANDCSGEYTLSVSLGSFYGDISKFSNIEKPMSIADKEMFSEKQRLKKFRH